VALYGQIAGNTFYSLIDSAKLARAGQDVAPLPIPWELGVPSVGGQLVTASGLIFLGAASDDYLRAFDLETGEELWKGRLPAGGQATPMSYRVHEGGRQYVVIAAGGHGRGGTTLGDYLMAWALGGLWTELACPDRSTGYRKALTFQE
jgi:glucose dehydrogenase